MTDRRRRSPLAVAIKNGKRGVEKYLRDQGCTISDDDKQELLFFACQHGQLDLVKSLVGEYNTDLTSKQ